MAKKTIEEKIKKVCWWAFGLSVLYFALGAFLQSDGYEFDPCKTYELIKDTLTLAAAFLAPVAAFVLFMNWREEHEVKSLFALLDSIKTKATEVEEQLVDYEDKIRNRVIEVNDDPNSLIHSEQITKNLIQLSILYREIDEKNENILDYMGIVQQFYSDASRSGNLLYVMESKSVIIKKFESLNRSRAVDEQIYPIPEKDTYDKNYQEYLQRLQKVEQGLNDLISESKKIKKKI